MSRECKLFCEGIARGELIVGKEGGNKNGENSVQIYLKCKKKSCGNLSPVLDRA